MRLLYILLFIALPFLCFSQYKYDYVWLLGSSSDPNQPIPTTGINILDFNNGALSVGVEHLPVEFFMTNSSICDDNGELLFYSNGCKIYNHAGQVMANGSGLNPGLAYSTGNCPDEGNTIPKGLLILPLPGDSSKYYVFHESGEDINGDWQIAKLYYSQVDMSENNGLGKVLEKNKVIIADTLHGDMHAVRHENGEDWWVFVSQATTNVIYRILFTKDGVAGVFEQQTGPMPDPWFSWSGTSCFSPDGTKYARFYKNEQMSLFDFDRSTGLLSNYQHYYVDTTGGNFNFGGISFSSSSRYLYVGTTISLYQFDLESADIQASRTLVGEYDGYLWFDQLPTTFGYMQLAPDCKIYIPSRNGSDILHVIHDPDEPGLACNFVQHEFYLPAINTSTIPNFPNYRLGTPYPVCDSSIQLVTSAVPVLPPAQEIRLWPNPARSEVQVALPAPLPSAGEWRLYGSLGQPVLRRALARGTTEVTLSLAGVPPGLYFWEVRREGQRLGSGKVVVQD